MHYHPSINSYYHGNVLLPQTTRYYLNYVFFGDYVAIHSTKRTNSMIRNKSPDHEIQSGSQDSSLLLHTQAKLAHMNLNEIRI